MTARISRFDDRKRRRVADGPDGDGDFGAAVEMTAPTVTKIATAIPRCDDETGCL